MYESELMERDMRLIHYGAITKALTRCKKPGNTAKPWEDFSIEHLQGRLMDEVREYFENPCINECHDIINMATFLALAHLEALKGDD